MEQLSGPFGGELSFEPICVDLGPVMRDTHFPRRRFALWCNSAFNNMQKRIALTPVLSAHDWADTDLEGETLLDPPSGGECPCRKGVEAEGMGHLGGCMSRMLAQLHWSLGAVCKQALTASQVAKGLRRGAGESSAKEGMEGVAVVAVRREESVAASPTGERIGVWAALKDM
jgi:hypothetical protein